MAAERAEAQQVRMIALTDLVPRGDQPRQHFGEEALAELSASIGERGVLTPLTVREVEGGFEILGGHRRHRAAGLAGLTEIPCIVYDLDDSEAREVVLLDNLQREDFLPFEEGAGYAELMDRDGKTVAEVARIVGKRAEFVRGRISVHQNAGQAVRQAYIAGRIGVGALEAIANGLPREEVSAVKCPRCSVILAGEPAECSACGADLAQVLGFPLADLQAVAVAKCAGKTAAQAGDIVALVAERNGLGAAPVQASMGFDVQQVAEEVLEVRSALERKLAEVTALQAWAAQKADLIGEYSPQAREVCRAQVRTAAAGLKYLMGILSEEEATS